MGVQKQVGMDWLVTANYLGNSGIHLANGYEADPAVYLPGDSCVIAGKTYSPCSSTSNTNQRRVLVLKNPDQGQYYGTMLQSDDGATRNYHGMALSLQKRRTKGVTILANYTLSQPVGLTADITPVGTTCFLTSSVNPSMLTSNVIFSVLITANSPSRTRPSCAASSNARGIEPADVLP